MDEERDYEYWKRQAMAMGLRFRTPEEIEQAEREEEERKKRAQEYLREIYLMTEDQRREKGYAEVFRRTCPVCGTVFYTGNPYKKYDDYYTCSRYIHRDNAKKARERARATKCTICGKSFIPQRAGALYCSAACKQMAYRKRVTNNACGQPGRQHMQEL